jgi:small subunit ribosomal protein S8
MNDPLANTLSSIYNNVKVGKSDCVVRPVSKLIRNVLNIMKDNGYISSFEEIEDGRGGMLKISFTGKINKCGVIKPRFNVKLSDYEKFEKRYLIAKDFGIIIVSTHKGLMTHTEAKEKNLGGKLIAYCY